MRLGRKVPVDGSSPAELLRHTLSNLPDMQE